MNRRKICIVTGSRADYGHLRWLMHDIQSDASLRLQIVATGMHLSKRFGSTYRVIEKDGFQIDKKIQILRFSDSEQGIAKTIGLGCSLFAGAFKSLHPDLIVVLGDRFEIFSAAIATYVAKIPLAHIHGGETSQGAMDEGFRHAITKMSSLHFAATEPYRRRIIQMGEDPKHVFNFGAPGLDWLGHSNFLDKEELAKVLKFNLEGRVALFTYHPTTLENGGVKKNIDILLKAIDSFDGKVVFTQTNADTHGRIIGQRMRKFCQARFQKCKFVPNMGQLNYLSCLKNFDFMIGNSSSGLVEAPSFKLPVVNVGDRQKGRIKAKNVIDVDGSLAEVKRAIHRALSPEFKESLKKIANPYERLGVSGASKMIKEKLKNVVLNESLIKKHFFDLCVNY